MEKDYSHDAGDDETSGRTVLVRYWWTCDGEGELCRAERVATPTGATCYHCGAPFTKDDAEAIKLTSVADGEAYLLHKRCAAEGVDAPDAIAIMSLSRR